MKGVDQLLDEYVQQKQYVEEEKPYWMNLTGGTRFSGELRYELENYFPEAHYNKAIDQAFQEQARNRVLEPDGGTTHLHQDGRRSKVYYWVNPETDATLVHSEYNGDEATPFFATVGDAERFLENRAETGDRERYEAMSLYKAKITKVEDAVEVLLDQADINDYW